MGWQGWKKGVWGYCGEPVGELFAGGGWVYYSITKQGGIEYSFLSHFFMVL